MDSAEGGVMVEITLQDLDRRSEGFLLIAVLYFASHQIRYALQG